jgi:Zn-finger nucleic acid-binding protein
VNGVEQTTDQTATLTCLKCGGRMRTYKRNGVTIDQCRDCRGVFLDRGELERLIAAESAYLGNDPAPARADGFLGELFE